MIPVRFVVRLMFHGAELDANKPPAAMADAFLEIKDGPWGRDKDEHGNREHQRDQERQGDDDAANVQNAFPPWRQLFVGALRELWLHSKWGKWIEWITNVLG